MTEPGVRPNLPTPSLEYFTLLTLGQHIFLHSGIKLEKSEEKSVLDQVKVYWVQIQRVVIANFLGFSEPPLP